MAPHRVIASLLLISAQVLAACSSTPARPDLDRTPIVFSTGTAAGASQAWGDALAQQLRTSHSPLDIKVESSSGNVANLRRLTIGTADLALTTMDATEPQQADDCITKDAAGADDQERVPLRALGRIYDDYLQIVVRADSPEHSVVDLEGHAVAVGATGSGTALVACRVLSAAKVSVHARALDVGPGLAALQAGHIDAVFWFGELPTSAVLAAATKEPLRLLSLGALADTMRTRYGAAYRPATLPPGLYGGSEQVATLASPNLLIARADADSAMVTAVLSAIFDHGDQIAAAVPAANATDRRTAILTGSLPLHPAAAAYYQRTKP
jgi:TRAP transporter TAXI family solute receptor